MRLSNKSKMNGICDMHTYAYNLLFVNGVPERTLHYDPRGKIHESLA